MQLMGSVHSRRQARTMSSVSSLRPAPLGARFGLLSLRSHAQNRRLHEVHELAVAGIDVMPAALQDWSRFLHDLGRPGSAAAASALNNH